MPPIRSSPSSTLVFVIDLQDKLLDHLHEPERLQDRAGFLIENAHLLGVPIIATEQAPERLGQTPRALRELLAMPLLPKTTFSALDEPAVVEAMQAHEFSTAVVIGAETHICVLLTALDLLTAGYDVLVCPDAVSSRTFEAHKLGMERLRDSGAVAAHTESLVYEWLGGSQHPRFRDALSIVKRYPL